MHRFLPVISTISTFPRSMFLFIYFILILYICSVFVLYVYICQCEFMCMCVFPIYVVHMWNECSYTYLSIYYRCLFYLFILSVCCACAVTTINITHIYS